MWIELNLLDLKSRHVQTRRLELANVAAAEPWAAAQGLAVLSARVVGQPASPRIKNKSTDVAWWCEQVRTLLAAGMSIVEALETVQAQTPNSSFSATNSLVLEGLYQGKSLSTAMAAAGSFPVMLLAGVKASEKTSTLGAALTEYLQHHQFVRALSQKTISAAIYPLMVGGLGLLISVFLLAYVVPRFSQMYAENAEGLSAGTRLVLWLSEAVSAHLSVWVAVATAVVALGVRNWDRGLRQRAQGVVSSIPFVERLVWQYRLANLYNALALLCAGGYSLPEAVQQCEGLEEQGRLRTAVQHVHAQVLQGKRFSHAMTQASLADETAKRLLAVGERSGNFSRVLATIARRHADNFTVGVERAAKIAEPTMLLLVSLLVGALVVLMYMPVFDIAASIG